MENGENVDPNRRASSGDKEQETQNTEVGIPDNKNMPTSRKNKPWVFHQAFSIEASHWDSLHDGFILHETYNEYFIKYLNEQLNVSCVLKSRGPYVAYERFVLRFNCKHVTCKRCYKIFQMEHNSFHLYNNNTDINHQGKIIRQIRGPQRQIVKRAMSNMLPQDYRVLCESGLNKVLYEQGNLQHAASDTTINKIRHESLSHLDFDKDEIVDLLKRKIIADYEFKQPKSETDVYLRRICLDPYMISGYSNAQFKCVKLLSDKNPEDELPFHFDATGSLVKHPQKKVYYYAGVTPAKLNQHDGKEQARLLSVIDFVSGEHDADNIAIQLKEYKQKYRKMYPAMKWPFTHSVTDFSFALLNAICDAWNNMELIKYINLTFLLANGINTLEILQDCGVCTFLQLCCGHLSKTHASDISKYFPTMDPKNQAVLKEIFAGMFDIDDLDTLRNIWKYLSTLLLSKFVNNDVEVALQKLAQIMVSDEDNNDDEENDDSEKDGIPTDIDTYKTIYEKSLFYQDFKSRSYRKEFDTNVGPANTFYSIQYAEVFLKKYVSILCLWTCLTQKKRKANAYGEAHFKNTKSRIRNKQTEIGAVPLKPGRFFQETEDYSKATTNAVILQIPRERCCGNQKRKLDDKDKSEPNVKKSKPNATVTLMSLYKSEIPKTQISSAIPRTPKTLTSSARPATPKTPFGSARRRAVFTPKATSSARPGTPNTPLGVTQTPTSSPTNKIPRSLLTQFDSNETENDYAKIDDPNVREYWCKKRKTKHSYVQKESLKTINKSNPNQLRKILQKVPQKSNGKGAKNTKMKNGLLDHPSIYLKPKENIAVSYNGKSILKKDEYQLLDESSHISNYLVQYVFGIFGNGASNVQFETKKSMSIIMDSSSVFKITKPIVIASLLIEYHFTLIIIDVTNRRFIYIDPKYQNSTQISHYFGNFKQFIANHNHKFSDNQIADNGWQIESYDHPILNGDDNHNSGIFIINMAKQYIDSNNINVPINPTIYRLELKHVILRSSKNMANKCVLCGLTNKLPNNTDESITWVECTVCARWTHMICVDYGSEEELSDESIHYLCIICQANTVANDGGEKSSSTKKL